MNRILLTGTALLALIGATVPANATRKHATRYQPVYVQQQGVGSGARVDAVDSNSPAARAGIRPGDRIVGINGSPISGISEVIPFVEGGGRPITVDIERGATHVRVTASPPNGRWRRGVLGITGTEFFFGNGESSLYVEPPPFQPPPPAPMPDPPNPAMFPPPQ